MTSALLFDVIKNEIIDIVGEFLNVFVGKFVASLFPDTLFELSLPQIEERIAFVNDLHQISFKDPDGNKAIVYYALKF